MQRYIAIQVHDTMLSCVIFNNIGLLSKWPTFNPDNLPIFPRLSCRAVTRPPQHKENDSFI